MQIEPKGKKVNILYLISLYPNNFKKKGDEFLFGKPYKKSKSLLIYYRKHSNKKYNLHSENVNKFSKHKIYIFGDHYKDKLVRNYGIINKKKLKLEPQGSLK